MSFQRAQWHSGLTYQQVCKNCGTKIRYTDESLDFQNRNYVGGYLTTETAVFGNRDGVHAGWSNLIVGEHEIALAGIVVHNALDDCHTGGYLSPTRHQDTQ